MDRFSGTSIQCTFPGHTTNKSTLDRHNFALEHTDSFIRCIHNKNMKAFSLLISIIAFCSASPLDSAFERRTSGADVYSARMTNPAMEAVGAGADLDEASIKSFSYGPGLTQDPEGFTYDAKNPPPCTTNCVMAFPKGHESRSSQNPVSDSEYLQDLISSLGSDGRIYVHPGYYEVSELTLAEGINIIGLYDASAGIKSAVFSGFMMLRQWHKLGNNLWSHDYPYGIANYDSQEGGTYFCKDPESNVCEYAQDLIMNGVMQTQWECEEEVGCVPLAANQWFFDRKSQPDTNPGDNFLLLRSYNDPNATDTRISHFRGAFKEGSTNVKVRNINFKGYTLQSFMTDDNWTVTNCVFEKNGVTGLSLRGKNVFVARNVVSENGCTGMQGQLTNSVLRTNKIINNNVMGHKPGMHAGGIKLMTALNTVVEENYVLDNEGAGIWVDINSNGVEVHHNLIVETKNYQGLQVRGVQYEMSRGNREDGKLDIHNNLLKVEGGIAGIICIYALNSQYLEIFNNTIINAQNGIVVKQDARGYTGNCANGYPGCNPCSGGNEALPCDDNCIADGNYTDDVASSRCLQQVRDIQVYYNNISVGGSGYLLTGLIIEPGVGQTLNEPNGIVAERYYNKNVYKIDIDYNYYTIPGNPMYSNCFQWGWDTVKQSSTRLVWDQANDYIDSHSCINGSCPAEAASARTLAVEIEIFPNPFNDFLSVSRKEPISEDVNVRLTSEGGITYDLQIVDADSAVFSFDTSELPKGNYVATVTSNGYVGTTHAQKN